MRHACAGWPRRSTFELVAVRQVCGASSYFLLLLALLPLLLRPACAGHSHLSTCELAAVRRACGASSITVRLVLLVVVIVHARRQDRLETTAVKAVAALRQSGEIIQRDTKHDWLLCSVRVPSKDYMGSCSYLRTYGQIYSTVHIMSQTRSARCTVLITQLTHLSVPLALLQAPI